MYMIDPYPPRLTNECEYNSTREDEEKFLASYHEYLLEERENYVRYGPGHDYDPYEY